MQGRPGVEILGSHRYTVIGEAMGLDEATQGGGEEPRPVTNDYGGLL